VDIAGCSLVELVEDPLTGLVVKSDGAKRREFELLLERIARERLRATRFAYPWPNRLLARETAPC